eukprot:2403239-Prymnesium_polylepis.1
MLACCTDPCENPSDPTKLHRPVQHTTLSHALLYTVRRGPGRGCLRLRLQRGGRGTRGLVRGGGRSSIH